MQKLIHFVVDSYYRLLNAHWALLVNFKIKFNRHDSSKKWLLVGAVIQTISFYNNIDKMYLSGRVLQLKKTITSEHLTISHITRWIEALYSTPENIYPASRGKPRADVCRLLLNGGEWWDVWTVPAGRLCWAHFRRAFWIPISLMPNWEEEGQIDAHWHILIYFFFQLSMVLDILTLHVAWTAFAVSSFIVNNCMFAPSVFRWAVNKLVLKATECCSQFSCSIVGCTKNTS